MSKPTKLLNIAPNYRNKARLWIEQAMLNSECAFNKGDKITIKYNAKSIVISKDDCGLKCVTGRTRHGRFIPIFEITNQAITDWCLSNECYRVRLTFELNKVIIVPAERNTP